MSIFLPQSRLTLRCEKAAMMDAMDGAAVIWAKGVRVVVAARHADEARRLLSEREARRLDADADEGDA